MFSVPLNAARLGAAWTQRVVTQHAPRLMCSSAANVQALAQAGARFGMSGGLVLGSGSVLVYGLTKKDGAGTESGEGFASSSHPWVGHLEANAEEMANPSALLRSHPVAKLVVEQDALFETMRSSSQIHEFRCFYEQAAKRFHSVVALGRDVCGFPQTVHGGLTAAIIDETFGGLGICCWRSGALGFRLPAYTARLEVDYKKKIPSGATILCTAELEQVVGRKVWMTAKVTDGKGQTFATARALFVAPRMPGEALAERVKGWFGQGRGTSQVASGGSGSSSSGKQ